ncbi:hypothetical protein BU16DRAFT_12302 [Lophium mytilinum]|uniref:Uncharacterized protein n=1 Tax=Lophium mytilinum TaxID=390894 RepID=A0A6A6RDS1_9PEZI|nr:hypothetical protein BU16DRAFT_12302 [Lophium mytilinum]
MLIPSSSVLRRIPWFDARLSSRWDPDEVRNGTNPVTGEQIKIWTYGLCYYEEGNCWLLGYDISPSYSPPKNRELVHDYYSKDEAFYLSEYASGFADSRWGREEVLIDTTWYHYDAIRDHKVLFALMYGKDIDLNSIPIGEACICLANTIAFFEYYCCFPEMVGRIITALRSLSSLWKDIPKRKWFYLSLSIKLRDFKIYAEAIRHIVGSDSLNDIPSAVVEAIRVVRTFKGLILEKREYLYDLATHLRCCSDT